MEILAGRGMLIAISLHIHVHISNILVNSITTTRKKKGKELCPQKD